eukprot:g2406.t1
MASPMERIVCLAFTVLGPITTDHSCPTHITSKRSRGVSFRELLGLSVHSFFHSIELGTLKTLTTLFSTTEQCLKRLGMEFPNVEESPCLLEKGFHTIQGWENETKKLSTDIINLSRDLEQTRKRCAELNEEVDLLRKQCSSYSEAGSILEQDREQLESLLSDKCKLIEENQNLERRISSLSELLQYATAEHTASETEEFENPPYFSSWEDFPTTEEEEEEVVSNGAETVIEMSSNSNQASTSLDFDDCAYN